MKPTAPSLLSFLRLEEADSDAVYVEGAADVGDVVTFCEPAVATDVAAILEEADAEAAAAEYCNISVTEASKRSWMLRRHCSRASTLSLVMPSILCSSSVDRPVKLAGGIGGGMKGMNGNGGQKNGTFVPGCNGGWGGSGVN